MFVLDERCAGLKKPVFLAGIEGNDRMLERLAIIAELCDHAAARGTADVAPA